MMSQRHISPIKYLSEVFHLNVDEQLQEVSGLHHDGGVQRDHVAFVQTQVQVGREPLTHKAHRERILVFKMQYFSF